jgi:hypothetical protein
MTPLFHGGGLSTSAGTRPNAGSPSSGATSKWQSPATVSLCCPSRSTHLPAHRACGGQRFCRSRPRPGVGFSRGTQISHSERFAITVDRRSIALPAGAPAINQFEEIRTMRRDQHIGEFMERPSRRPAVRLDLGGILPPHIQRGAAEMAVFQRRIKRILVDDRRPRDVDQQSAPASSGRGGRRRLTLSSSARAHTR